MQLMMFMQVRLQTPYRRIKIFLVFLDVSDQVLFLRLRQFGILECFIRCRVRITYYENAG